MARPQQARGTNGGGSSDSFPSDLDSLPYFMSLHFVKYERPTGEREARFSPQGNVFLPLPMNLQETYGINYGQDGVGSLRDGGLQDFITTGGSLAEEAMSFLKSGVLASAFAGDISAINESRRALTGDLGKYIVAMSPRFLQDNPLINRAGNAYLGIVKNPHMTMIFDGVELRQHQLQWMFSPRTAAESATLQRIINRLRRAAHPDFSPGTGRYALDFPLQVFGNFIGSSNLYPIKRSVITNISVDHAASGQGPAFYANNGDGAPVQIALSVSLVETEILTVGDFDSTNLSYTADGGYAPPSTENQARPNNGGGA